MKRFLLASVGICVLVAPANAQDTAEIKQRLDKARTEVNDLRNGANRALYAIDKALEAVGISTPTPTPTPVPTPTPTPEPTPTEPTPTPTPTPVPTPTPTPPPATNWDPTTALQPAWGTGKIPASGSPDVVGAFRFICAAGKLGYFDPIVQPGVVGKSHLHQFYGAEQIDENSTRQSLMASGESGCNKMTGTNHAANASGYWMPAVFDGKGNVVMADYVQVYYKRRPFGPGTYCDPANLKGVGAWGGHCEGIPDGLKFISGFDMVNGKEGAQQGWMRCGSGPFVDTFAKAAASGKCVAGAKLELSQQSPSCWNGQLDSANHMSHLVEMVASAATNYVKQCPKTHPILIAQVTFSPFYTLQQGDDVSKFSLSSDAMYPNLAAGSTLHMDYFEAWVPTIKQMWVDNCIGKLLNCSGGDLGNGQQLRGASVPIYNGKTSWTNPTPRVPIPANPMAGM